MLLLQPQPPAVQIPNLDCCADWRPKWGVMDHVGWNSFETVFPSGFSPNSCAIPIAPTCVGRYYETLNLDCRIVREKVQFLCIAIHSARDGVCCETLKPGLSCLLGSGLILFDGGHRGVRHTIRFAIFSPTNRCPSDMYPRIE